MNTTTDEIFVAYGSTVFNIPGDKLFLKIITQGPANGGTSSSSIEWLGAYIFDNGRIAQIVGGFTAANFDIYSGTATQVIPEPTSGVLLALGAMAAMMTASRHRRSPGTIG